jgi:multimeric flavodoxin WrbA
MKIVVLNGSPRINGNTAKLVEEFKIGAELASHEVHVILAGALNIKGCLGCDSCHNIGAKGCVVQDDMTRVYKDIVDADMIVLASPVYYFGLTGQLQNTISRFYSLDKIKKVHKYALLLTSYSPNVYDAIISQYKQIVSYFNAEDMGIITAYGAERGSESKLKEVFEFARNL